LDEAVKTASVHPAIRSGNMDRKLYLLNGAFVQEYDLANVPVSDNDVIVIMNLVAGG